MDVIHEIDGLIRLDEEQCWLFLRKHAIGRIAIDDMGWPMVFPVNYLVDGDSVIFRTSTGTKLAQAAAENRVAFEVDDAFDVLETGASVVVHGTLRRVTDRAEKARLATLGLRPWAPGDRDQFVRVVPKWITGRRITAHTTVDGLDADAG